MQSRELLFYITVGGSSRGEVLGNDRASLRTVGAGNAAVALDADLSCFSSLCRKLLGARPAASKLHKAHAAEAQKALAALNVARRVGSRSSEAQEPDAHDADQDVDGKSDGNVTVSGATVAAPVAASAPSEPVPDAVSSEPA